MKDEKLRKEIKSNIAILEAELLYDLKGFLGTHFSDNAVVILSNNNIEIGVNYENRKGYKYDFASDITIYSKKGGIAERDVEINYGSSGCFTPENQASYWRTIHAGIVLLNWEFICDTVEKYCSLYRYEMKKLNN